MRSTFTKTGLCTVGTLSRIQNMQVGLISLLWHDGRTHSWSSSTVEPRLSGPRLSGFPNNQTMGVVTHALYNGGTLQVFS